jgi:DNA-directed RNA polymerase specialized sigma24 family protein
MRPADIFDIVLERVREYQALQLRIVAIRADASAKGGPATVGNVISEYIADFQVCGMRALKRWPKRAQMFKLYFVDGMTQKQVCKQLSIPSTTLDFWHMEIKKTVGRELRETALYPPSHYRLRTVRKEEAND